LTSLHDRQESALTVLHAVPHLDRVGGCERQALLLARHQAQRTPRAGGVQPMLLTHQQEDVARPSESPAAPPDPPLPSPPTAPHVWQLARGLRRYHPGAWWRNHGASISLVHAHAVHKLCGQVVALAARDGVPSLVKVATPEDIELFAEPARWRQFTEPEQDPAHYGPRWRWMAALTWRRLQRSSAFLALNDDIAARLLARGLRVERIRNAVDCVHFQPAGVGQRMAARAALGLDAEAPCIASVGRLVARKDLSCVLQALARSSAGHSAGAPGGAPVGRADRLTLLVCGDGPQAPALRRLAQELRIEDRVRWLGRTADVRTALHAADAFVHASRSEGFPNALLEALACGLPAVLSDIPGHRDEGALPDDLALLFPPGDHAALAAALARLLADPNGRAARGAAARSVALRHYALPVVGPQLERIYARHLALRPAPRDGSRRGERG